MYQRDYLLIGRCAMKGVVRLRQTTCKVGSSKLIHEEKVHLQLLFRWVCHSNLRTVTRPTQKDKCRVAFGVKLLSSSVTPLTSVRHLGALWVSLSGSHF